jgi:hypothetical protein
MARAKATQIGLSGETEPSPCTVPPRRTISAGSARKSSIKAGEAMKSATAPI